MCPVFVPELEHTADLQERLDSEGQSVTNDYYSSYVAVQMSAERRVATLFTHLCKFFNVRNKGPKLLWENAVDVG